MANQYKAYLFGLATVLMWSTVASAFKLSLRYLDPAQLLLYSSLTSIVVLGVIQLWRGKLGDIVSCSPREYLLSFKLGILNPFFYYLVLFKAYDLLPAQVAQPLNYTWALMLTYLSIPLLKQTIRIREIIAGIICYSGVVVIFTRGNPLHLGAVSPLGVALALGSTVIWALYWIFTTKDTRDPVSTLLLNFLFGLPFIFVYCLIFSHPGLPTLPGLAGALYVGVFEMGITFALWLLALKLSENTARVSNLIFISPFLSLFFIHVFVGEEIYLSTFVGLVLIVTGLITQHWRSSVKVP